MDGKLNFWNIANYLEEITSVEEVQLAGQFDYFKVEGYEKGNQNSVGETVVTLFTSFR